jgi:hypothetical protein
VALPTLEAYWGKPIGTVAFGQFPPLGLLTKRTNNEIVAKCLIYEKRKAYSLRGSAKTGELTMHYPTHEVPP